MRHSFLLRAFVFLVLVVGAAGLWGQGAQVARGKVVRVSKQHFRPKAACTDDAGQLIGIRDISVANSSLGNVADGSSIAYGPILQDTIFLCFGDRITIDHDAASADFVSGDPNTSTLPGIVYGVYDCPPTIEGPTVDDIDDDPCNTLSGLSPFDDASLAYIVPGFANYTAGDFDILLVNDGPNRLPTSFPDGAGNPRALVMTFAPITADAIDRNSTTGEPTVIYETGPDPDRGDDVGCVNVSVDQYLTIGWLNPIEVVDEVQSTTDCSGSFIVQGGVGELRGTNEYTINISSLTTGEVVATDQPSNTYGSGDLVTYTVPGGGEYLIEIEDGISCVGSDVVTHEESACAVVAPVCDNDAGEILEFTNVNISGNSLGSVPAGGTVPFSARPDTIFLCRGDEFTLNHDESSAVLDYDPVPSTTPGVVYGVYTDLPTVTGTSLDALDGDPANASGGIPPFEGGEFVGVGPVDFLGGDYDLRVENVETPFNNDFFPGPDGRPGPITLTLAPVTVTGSVVNAAGNRDFIFESSLTEPECTNARIDQYVTTAFLNPITVEDAVQSSTDCSGSFVIRGGVSELRGTADYTITLTNTTTNEVVSLDNSSTYSHAETVSYNVPSPGEYLIEVEDAQSCTATQLVNHSVTSCGTIDPPVEPTDCSDNAGQITAFIDINVSSNTFGDVPPGGTVPYTADRDTVFLCAGDEFTIDLDESTVRVDGDPNSFTQPGIGYGIYLNQPRSLNSGPTYENINADPGLFKIDFPPLQLSGDRPNLVPPANYAARNYDLTIFNNLEPLPPAVPKTFIFAPITVDGFIETDSTFLFEGQGEPNECNVVGFDQTVTVTLLDPIELNGDVTVDECTGSFTVIGGTSEFYGTADFTISVVSTTGGLTGAVAAPGTHGDGDVVSYTVPEPGDYRITVSDGKSCEFTTIVTHVGVCEEPPSGELVVTADPTPISCTGLTDGTIAVTATGGTAPYTAVYVRTTPATPPLTGTQAIATDGGNILFGNLDGGVYRVTVTDAVGAEQIITDIEVFQPNISVDIQIVEGFQCFDDLNGSLRAVIFDGSDPLSDAGQAEYDFLWSNNATTRTITDLAPGTYSVTATNRLTGCPTSATLNFRAPNRLLIQNELRLTDPATCSGVSDGALRVPISGGTLDEMGNFTISWSDGIVTQSDEIRRSDLQPGSYTVTVTDDNGCMAETSFLIPTEKTIVITADSSSVSCFGDVDGSVSVTGSTDGAAPDLPFQASLLSADGSVLRDFATVPGGGSTPLVFENLAPGTYTIVLRDSDPEGCEMQQSVTVTEPALLEIADVTTTNVGCPDQGGTATVGVSGGTGPYTFRFVNDSLPMPMDSTVTFDSTTVGNLNSIGELAADTNYVAIVTDANGCIDSTTFRILSPPQAVIEPILNDFVSCPGASDGQLTVVATPPPGDSITITDIIWYRLNADNTLGEQVAVGQTTSENLAVGAYVVEVTLSNQCTSFGFGQVVSPGLVTLDSLQVLAPSCLGDDNGSIFLFPSGGTPNTDGTYNYVFSDGNGPPQTTRENSYNSLSAGTYTITIIDANGCQPPFDTTLVLEEPIGIVGDFTIDDVSCPSDTTSDGIATFEAVLSDGNTGTFDFFWSTGDTVLNQSSATVRDLTRGPISVTVTDGLCPQVFTDTIGSPEDFDFGTSVVDVSCNGLGDGSVSVTPSGGTPGYTFEWVGRGEVSGALDSLTAGFYQVVVTDANGCRADTVSLAVNQPDSLILAIDPNLTTPLVTCAGDEDGVIAVGIASTNNNPLGDSPYTWSANVIDNDDGLAQNLPPGTYGVTVTDVLGCQDSLSYTIVEPQPIVFAVEDILPPACFGETTDIIIDTVFGGQASGIEDFTYTINNDGFLIPADQPGSTFAGQTIVTVFDSVGCSAEDTFDIQQPEELLVELPEQIIIELGDTLQRLEPVVTPPDDGTYTYEWTTPTPPSQLSNDSIRDPFIRTTRDQDYTLTVTNANGCQALDDILVLVDANRNIYLPNAFSPNNDGRNDDFRIHACRGVAGITQVLIYNRWGGLVHEATNLGPDCQSGTLLWNGRSTDDGNGQPLGMGVYVYVVQVLFLDGVELTYRGDISIIR